MGEESRRTISRQLPVVQVDSTAGGRILIRNAALNVTLTVTTKHTDLTRRNTIMFKALLGGHSLCVHMYM